jgi:signal peptidase II
VSRPALTKIYTLLLGIAAAVVALDQITKTLAVDALKDGPVDVVSGAVTLRLTYNSGGAFGVLQGLPALFMIATVIVVAVILIWARGLDEVRWAIPLGMVLGGGLGNVADRLFRATHGRVVDFVDLHVWPVFNLADSMITIGVLAILLLSLRTSPEPKDGSAQAEPSG